MPGFVKNNFDIKLIVLYILSKTVEPATFDEISQVALCDEGVDYFLLKQSIDEMIRPENILLEEDCYTITPRGQQNLESCMDQLPLSLQQLCDQGLITLNRELLAKKFVKAQVIPHQDTTCSVHLQMTDPTGTILELNLLTPRYQQAEDTVRAFRLDPPKFYHTLMETVTSLTEEINQQEAEKMGIPLPPKD